MFMGILISIVNASNHTKYVSLSYQKCEIQPTFINIHPTEYSQEFHYYPFTVKLDKCVGSCNTLNDLSNIVCVPNKTEDLTLNVFSMITGINESKKLTKHICECKCKFDGRNCHCVKSVRIRSYSGPHFGAFGSRPEYGVFYVFSPSARKCRPE